MSTRLRGRNVEDMLIEKNSGWVAMWWFETPLPVPERSRDSLHNLLVMCQTVARVLAKHELLEPSTALLKGWTQPGADAPRILAQEPALEVPLVEHGGASGIVDACEHAMAGLEPKRGFLYPIYIHVVGRGAVFDGEGNRCEQPDVCWVEGTTLGHQLVYVRTQSDAWLPYTLRAEPQPDVSRRNAPRLEAAIQEIRAATGVEASFEEETPYAINNGYTLSNHTYDDGEIVETV
jgi:hypothetical protein